MRVSDVIRVYNYYAYRQGEETYILSTGRHLRTKSDMSGKRIPPYTKERILMLSKKGANYSEISRELTLWGCPVSRQTISAFVKCSNNELTDLKTAVKKRKCKRVLKMEHFEYIDNEMAKSDELCAVGKNLHFNDHIVKVTASCMSTLGQINRIKHVFTTELLIIIINALVFSKLFYCSSVWSSTSGKNIKKLQYIQNFAARIIRGHRKYDHVTPILKELHWLPVKEHLYYRDAVLAFKCMNGMVPEYLSSQFTARGAVSGRKTRQSGQLNIPLFTSATGQKTFQYRITKIWNDLPSNLKLSRTISSFKTELKKILLNEFLNM